MEMFATATPMPAERLAALGVMNRLVSEDQLEAETYALARGIAANAPLSVACSKLHVRKLAAAFAASLRGDPALAAARAAAVASNDYEEGLAALRERRAPRLRRKLAGLQPGGPWRPAIPGAGRCGAPAAR